MTQAEHLQVIYLDFDGVLHPDDVWRRRGTGVYLGGRYPGHALFENTPSLIDALAGYPSVRIVLSTSWVRVLRYSHVCKRLPDALRERVVGATFHTAMHRDWFESLKRGEQVLRDVSRRRPEAWVALDDDEEGWGEHAERHLVHCDSEFGLRGPGVPERLSALLLQNFGPPETANVQGALTPTL